MCYSCVSTYGGQHEGGVDSRCDLDKVVILLQAVGCAVGSNAAGDLLNAGRVG